MERITARLNYKDVVHEIINLQCEKFGIKYDENHVENFFSLHWSSAERARWLEVGVAILMDRLKIDYNTALKEMEYIDLIYSIKCQDEIQ